MRSFGNSRIAKIMSMLLVLTFMFMLLPSGFVFADGNGYTMTITDNTTDGKVSAGSTVIFNIQLDGAMADLKMVQYSLEYDSTELTVDISGGRNPKCFETEWWAYVNGGNGLGYIDPPTKGVKDDETNSSHKLFGSTILSGNGYSIDSESDIYNATTAVAGKVIFTALKDIADISKCVTLKNAKVQKLIGNAGKDQETKAVQLVSKVKDNKPTVTTGYTMTITDNTTDGKVSAGSTVIFNIQLDGAMADLKMVQYSLEYDSTELTVDISGGRNPKCFETEWWAYVNGGNGLGYIDPPTKGVKDDETNSSHKLFGSTILSGNGYSIDSESDIYNATTAVAGKVIFTALKDIADISKCVTLKNAKVQKLIGNAGKDQETKAVQLVSKATGDQPDPDQEKVDAVVEKINALPAADSITLENKAAVEAARKAYDDLGATLQAKVSADVLARLTNAEAKIADLEAAANQDAKDEAAAAAFTAKVDALTVTSLDQKEEVEALRAEFTALTDGAKAKVSEDTKAKLKAAEDKIKELKDEADQNAKDEAAAAAFTAKVDALTVTSLDQKGDVEALRAEFTALSSGAQAKVSEDTKAKLKAAEDKIKELEKADAQEKADAKIAEDFTNAVNALGNGDIANLTLEDANTVKNLRSQYDGFTENVTAKISSETVTTLENAETKIEELEAAADQAEKDRTSAEKFTSDVEALGNADDLTLDDEQKVNDLKNTYDNVLTAGAKALVSEDTVAKLNAAVTKITALKEEAKQDKEDTEAANAFTNAVNALGEVDLAKAETVKALRAQYEDLTDGAKAKVEETTLKLLEAAEKKIADLEEADKQDKADAEAANAFTNAVNALGEVDLTKEDTVKALRTQYEDLTDGAKAKVEEATLKLLENAEKKIAELKKPVSNTTNTGLSVSGKNVRIIKITNVKAGVKVTVDGVEAHMFTNADGSVTYIVVTTEDIDEADIVVDENSKSEDVVLGSVTGNESGVVADDAYLINKVSANITDNDSVSEILADPYMLLLCDVNGDGVVDAADALLVARRAAGQNVEFKLSGSAN